MHQALRVFRVCIIRHRYDAWNFHLRVGATPLSDKMHSLLV